MLPIVVVLCLLLVLSLASGCGSAEADFAQVTNPKLIPVDKIPCERVVLGEPEDYKPCLVLLPGGEIILVAFQQESKGGGKVQEDMFFYRSKDGGRTWSQREFPGLLGREPYFSKTKGGILFITTHLLDSDIRNTDGYIHSYLHRSADGGKSWTTLKIGAEDVPGTAPKTWTHTSRNVLELRNGTLILGVSAGSSVDYMWRSKDKGKTWDRSLRCVVHGFDVVAQGFPWFAETVFWQPENGDILAIARCSSSSLPQLMGVEIPVGDDSVERICLFRSKDGGANWTLEPEIGNYYGEMYQALLRLKNRKLLFTFTVRALKPPLGVKCVLGDETPDGFRFDFNNDRIAVDSRTPVGQPQGGGFGNTIQIKDGTLLTAYSYRGEDGKTHIEVARWKLPRLKQ